jgi:uncharacterized membrane protein (GlpM family)
LLKELLLRFVIGGTVVCFFAFIGDLFKPKRFAGLFGAAPSVALATLSLTIVSKGKTYAAIETRSMIAGAMAFLAYAYFVAWMLMRYKPPTKAATLISLVVWFGIALGLWAAWLR